MKAALAVALLLLLAGAAQAGPRPLIEGTAVSVTVAGDGTRLSGPLAAIHVAAPDSDLMAFHAEGSIRVEVDHQTMKGYGVTYVNEGNGTDRPGDAYAAVDGTAGRASRELIVFPLPGQSAEVVSRAASAAVATPSTLDVRHIDLAGRDPPSVDVDGLRVSGSGLEVRGSFVVALWEWDFDAVGADGSSTPYWTGVHMTPAAGLPEETAAAVRESRHQQAFLFVDGVLTLPAGALPVAYLPAAAADVHGALTLQGVQADLAGPDVAQPVSADRFSLRGDLRVDLGAPADGRVPFLATGDGDQTIEVDGATLHWTGPSGGAGRPAWMAWAPIAALAILAPPAAYGARRGYLRWEGNRLAQAEDLLEMEAYGDARNAVRPLLRSARLRPEAVVIHVESLLAEGKAGEALPFLDEPGDWAMAPGLRDYLAARAHAVLGDLAAARAALERALAVAPELHLQAAAEPLLRPLTDEPPEGYT